MYPRQTVAILTKVGDFKCTGSDRKCKTPSLILVIILLCLADFLRGVKDVFNSFCEVLFAKFVNGATLMFSFDMSNTVSPGVSSILSLIVSRFSSGYFSRDVL